MNCYMVKHVGRGQLFILDQTLEQSPGTSKGAETQRAQIFGISAYAHEI